MRFRSQSRQTIFGPLFRRRIKFADGVRREKVDPHHVIFIDLNLISAQVVSGERIGCDFARMDIDFGQGLANPQRYPNNITS